MVQKGKSYYPEPQQPYIPCCRGYYHHGQWSTMTLHSHRHCGKCHQPAVSADAVKEASVAATGSRMIAASFLTSTLA